MSAAERALREVGERNLVLGRIPIVLHPERGSLRTAPLLHLITVPIAADINRTTLRAVALAAPCAVGGFASARRSGFDEVFRLVDVDTASAGCAVVFRDDVAGLFVFARGRLRAAFVGLGVAVAAVARLGVVAGVGAVLVAGCAGRGMLRLGGF